MCVKCWDERRPVGRGFHWELPRRLGQGIVTRPARIQFRAGPFLRNPTPIGLLSRSFQDVGRQLSAALDLHRVRRAELEAIPQELVGRLCHLDLARGAVRLHAAGHVHGVAPKIVAELFRADDTGNHRAAVDADSDLAGLTIGSFKSGDLMLHVEGHCGDGLGVVRARFG